MGVYPLYAGHILRICLRRDQIMAISPILSARVDLQRATLLINVHMRCAITAGPRSFFMAALWASWASVLSLPASPRRIWDRVGRFP